MAGRRCSMWVQLWANEGGDRQAAEAKLASPGSY